MSAAGTLDVRLLTSDELPLMRDMLTLFGEAFGEAETYSRNRPSNAYLERLLGKPDFIALAACLQDEVVGGLAAYVLEKFERERSEIYIYDLAVASDFRRQGVATALIRELQGIARERAAWVIFVQADHGDEPAIALYDKLGKREHVLHFDISVDLTQAEK